MVGVSGSHSDVQNFRTRLIATASRFGKRGILISSLARSAPFAPIPSSANVTCTSLVKIFPNTFPWYNLSGSSRVPKKFRSHLTGYCIDPRTGILVSDDEDCRWDSYRDNHLNDNPVYIHIFHRSDDILPLSARFVSLLAETLSSISCPVDSLGTAFNPPTTFLPTDSPLSLRTLPSSPQSYKRRKTDSELTTTNRVVSALNDRYVPKLDAVSVSPKRQRSQADLAARASKRAQIRSTPRTNSNV